MFRIKICGITRVDDARLALEAGADAIGLNFYPASPRYVTPDAAREIAAAVSERMLVVGVFVNEAVDLIVDRATELALGAVQLHGDEAPTDCARLAVALARACPERRPPGIVRACRVGGAEIRPVAEYLEECVRLVPAEAAPLAAVLFDAERAGAYGGTGEPANWEAARRWVTLHPELPLILAGGLKPENVAEAIRAVGPWGVDTASGVESSPGVKDAERVRLFVGQARREMGGP